MKEKLLATILVSIALIFFGAWILSLLWNYIIVDLTGFKAMGYWQAFLLVAFMGLIRVKASSKD